MIMAEPSVVKDEAWWTDWHLNNWARWMTKIELPKGVPDCASGGVENYTTHDAHNEKAYDALDAWLAETTHVVIQGLVETEKAAIYCRYVEAIYRFPRGNFEELLARAVENVRAGLKRRQVWLGE